MGREAVSLLLRLGTPGWQRVKTRRSYTMFGCRIKFSLDIVRRLANNRCMNQVFKALSDPTRRHVLELLRRGPLAAGELASHFDVSKPTMSAHFAVLKEADLVAAEKQGRNVVYRLKLSVLEDALLSFARLFGVELSPAPPGRSPAKPSPPIPPPKQETP